MKNIAGFLAVCLLYSCGMSYDGEGKEEGLPSGGGTFELVDVLFTDTAGTA
jgi:hypothetical protein